MFGSRQALGRERRNHWNYLSVSMSCNGTKNGTDTEPIPNRRAVSKDKIDSSIPLVPSRFRRQFRLKLLKLHVGSAGSSICVWLAVTLE